MSKKIKTYHVREDLVFNIGERKTIVTTNDLKEYYSNLNSEQLEVTIQTCIQLGYLHATKNDDNSSEGDKE